MRIRRAGEGNREALLLVGALDLSLLYHCEKVALFKYYAKPAAYDDSNYWYEAPTGDGPHGYIRIFSEVSANDRAHYADVQEGI